MSYPQMPEGIPLSVFKIESDNPFEGVAIASVLGDLATLGTLDKPPLVRLHSACVYGEILRSVDCECGPQLDTARERIIEEGVGILFYLHQEGRGAGLAAKARGYQLKDEMGLDTAAAYEKLGLPFDQRQYGHCARFLVNSKITSVRLMSNNPRKIIGLEQSGITVTREPLIVGVNDANVAYLRIKRGQGHLLPDDL